MFKIYVKRKYLCCITIILFFISLLCTEAAYAKENEIELYARSAVLMDGDSGRILYGKEADVPLPMASTTKIMTCIIALEYAKDDMVCHVSVNAASQPKVKLGMQTGQTFYLKDLLYSLMLESHNDTAVCIAENIAGSTEAFAEWMNQKAGELGCENTYYITPNGLDAENENGNHRTTAAELAVIMRYCLTQSEKAEEFLEITAAPSYTFSNIERTQTYTCINHNTLFSIMDGVQSGKTGFTNKAGYCYVGAVEKDGKLLIVSLLACGWPNNKGYKWADTKKLVRYGLDNFEKQNLIDPNVNTGSAAVMNGVQRQVSTVIDWGNIAEEKKKTILMQEDEQLQTVVRWNSQLEAPVEKACRIGEVNFLADGKIYASYPILTEEGVEKATFFSMLKKLTALFSV